MVKVILGVCIITSLILGGCARGIPVSSRNIVREDGAYRLEIDISGSLQNPAFSPDGKSIVFTRFHDGYNTGVSDLFIYNLETGELNPLVADGSSNVNLPGCAWNGGHNLITFSSDREPHDEIYLISALGMAGDEIRLTERRDKQSYEPTFSPDGQWLVFESHNIDVEDDGVITKYKRNGSSEYIDLTAAGDDCKQPNWSPVGDKILYQKKENGRWAIWTMDVNGSNQRMITGFNENDTDAVFSSDGEWIFYSSENDAVRFSNIYKIPADGGLPIRITRYDGYDGAPSISPDGTKLAFESTDKDPAESPGTSIWVIDIHP